MLTREEFIKYKKEVQAFLKEYPQDKENTVHACRISQVSYLFLMMLEDDYTERD